MTLPRARPLPLLRLLLATILVALALQPGSAQADPYMRQRGMLGVVDAASASAAARDLDVGWDRVVFLWQEIQPYQDDDWYLDRYVSQFGIQPALDSGRPLVAVVQGTPQWAAGTRTDGASAVPLGLNYQPEDKENGFGRFMLRLVQTYKGRIGAWVIGNEPDFRPGDSGTWSTWAGNTADFAQFVRTGYRAVKLADPRATVVFPATTYFVDAINQRDLFFARVLAEIARDSEAVRNNFYFDAVAVNMYCAPDVIYRVHGLYQAALAAYRQTKPLWITETNCPIYNDRAAPVATPAYHLSTSEQAAYAIQAFALARAAGYERIAWYAMRDHDPRRGITDLWGLLHPDGTPRPAYHALRVASRYLADSQQAVRLAPAGGTADNPALWRVLFEDPLHARRVQVLWRATGGPDLAALQAQPGSQAHLLDVLGRTSTPRQAGGAWQVPLPLPRTPQTYDPPGYPSFGDPVLLVETELPADRPYTAPGAALFPPPAPSPSPAPAPTPAPAATGTQPAGASGNGVSSAAPDQVPTAP